MFFWGGDPVVVVCGDCLACVRCVYVFVVEAAYEPQVFGGIGVVCNGVEKLFPFCLFPASLKLDAWSEWDPRERDSLSKLVVLIFNPK